MISGIRVGERTPNAPFVAAGRCRARDGRQDRRIDVGTASVVVRRGVVRIAIVPIRRAQESMVDV